MSTTPIFVEEVHQAKGDDVLVKLKELLEQKFTGAVVIHVSQGHAQVLEWRKKLTAKK